MLQKGFTHILLIILVVVATIIVIGASAVKKSNPKPLTQGTPKLFDRQEEKSASNVTWEFDRENKTWQAKGNPPDCPNPLIIPSPVDLSLASGILYPGQIRGGDYKPHGGARFDNLPDNNVNVYAPIDAKLTEASRHLTSGEPQYTLYFLHDCGVIYKLDHLRELTAKVEEIIKNVPMAGESDTRTTGINPPVFIGKGELLATKVGVEHTKNVFYDFGLYDLRKKNGVNYGGKNYFNIEQYGEHALCWLDYLEEKDKKIAYSLPGADGQSGKTSDYCK